MKTATHRPDKAGCARSVTVRKSVLLSLMFIGGILGLVGFSMASFIDQETQSAQITAGTLDLDAGSSTACTIEALGSGGSDDCTFSFTNEGSLSGTVWALILADGKPCSDTTYGANDDTEYCDSSADLQPANVSFCGRLGSAPTTCPTPTLLNTVTGTCVIVDSSLEAGGTLNGDYQFTLSDLMNIQQGDAVVVTWQLFLTESSSTTAPAECTALQVPAGPGI